MDGPGCYLLHFDQPFSHARHYTGWGSCIAARVDQHRRGGGARLMQHVTAAGIGFTVARIWPGADRAKERRLKRSGSASRYCPVCRPGLRVPRVTTDPVEGVDPLAPHT